MAAIEGQNVDSTETKNMGLFTQLSLSFKKIPGLPQIIILGAIALSIALGIAIALWAHKPEYKVLYMGLDSAAQAQIVDVLEKQQTPYRINHMTGDILVPQDQFHTIKMRLAGEGIKPGSNGLEIIHDEQAIGVSQFIEGKRYHHALETELGRTIGSLQSVSKARVHLAVPKTSSFVRQQTSASASVLLHILSGRAITHQQVKAIQELVSSSIAGLATDQVSVVDQRGNLLSQEDDVLSQSNRHYDYQHQLEKKYIQRIQNLLAPIVGYDNISAQVSIEMDFSHREETREQYDPTSQTVRSERSHSKSGVSNANVGGVPGSISNQPVAKGKKKDNKVTTTSGSSLGSAQVHRNYEIDKTLSYKQKGAGEILRISAAVIINTPATNTEGIYDGATTNANGLAVRDDTNTPVISNDNISQLVKDAIGYMQQRGDSVTVMNANFLPEVLIEETPVSFVDQIVASDKFYTILRYFISAILLLILIFKIIKPTITSMMAHFQEKKADETADIAPQDEKDTPSQSYEDKLELIRQRISTDPMTTAQVMKSWMKD